MLAQEFFQYNPARLPTPSEWVGVRKIREKELVDFLRWFSRTDEPKVRMDRVMRSGLKSARRMRAGYRPAVRPSVPHHFPGALTLMTNSTDLPFGLVPT